MKNIQESMGAFRAALERKIEGAAKRIKHAVLRLGSFARSHAGRIAYYGGMALALCIIACAAEHYRPDRSSAVSQLILPAAEIESVSLRAEETRFSIPEGMERIAEWSDKPLWNHFLGCWQTHPGVDYICADDLVRSMSDGRVRTVGKSGVYGGFIEVEAGEYLLKYASMLPDSEIEPGMQVKAGDLLGAAACGMPSEADLGNHLHLEVRRGNENLNFEALINEKQINAD